MIRLMRRLILSSALALVALAGLVSSAAAATKPPVITSFSPAQVRVGQTLVINGKNFKKGITNNRVFFVRASDGKTVRARPSKADSTRQMQVVVPPALTKFLAVVNGQPSATRFQIYVLSGRFSKMTPKSKSPIVLPANATPSPGTTTPGGTTVTPPPACAPSTTPGVDSDGDGLPDTLETQIGTDPCKADTDGDGVNDAFEYYSALDLNGNNLPYPGKRPYPNPLDGTDANKDFDGDGMTMIQEYNAWVLSGKPLPSGPGASFAYSDGNAFSPAPNGAGAMDLNVDGQISDDEKDVDNDGIPNWVEMAHGDKTAPPTSSIQDPTKPCTFIDGGRYTSCTLSDGTTTVIEPNGNTFQNITATIIGTPPPPFWFQLDYANPDSDGDTVIDGQDDQDHDGISNVTEMANHTNPVDPCDPNPHAAACPQHTPGG